MTFEIGFAIFACALGTFAMRCIPLIWMHKHLDKQQQTEQKVTTPVWLGLIGSLMIAGMLGASLVPTRVDWVGGLSTLVGVVVTIASWYRFRSLGLPVFLGVLAFGIIALVFK